jgi:putative tryptophan/tyrosine transport system substrate-binding protein
MFLALSFPAKAQPSGKMPRIGVLVGATLESPNVAAFRRGPRDFGYDEGKNIAVEYRFAEGKNERFPSLVAELVQRKVDVLVLSALPAVRAAKPATKTIPIVMLLNADPVAARLVDSLARPGGNITGLTKLTRELSGNRLELLKEASPRHNALRLRRIRLKK